MAQTVSGDEHMTIGLGIKIALITAAVCVGYAGIVHYDIRSHADEPAHSHMAQRATRLETAQQEIQKDVDELKKDIKDVKKGLVDMNRTVDKIYDRVK